MRRSRIVDVPRPDELGRRDGLAYSLWTGGSGATPRRGVVILHGAGSTKESHHDFARALLPPGFAAIAFDQRGHGASDGPMDGRALQDVATMAGVLREAIGDPAAPVGIRGSSMGGLLAILAAPLVDARAVVAICPATPDGLARGIRRGRFELTADADAVAGLLEGVDLAAEVQALTAPLLIMHAEGDEVVPIDHSRALATHLRVDASRLIAVPGGHHRSIQHDDELQAVSLRFLDRHLR